MSIARMSFRRRMVLLAAGAVAAAIVLASVVVYVVTRNELRGQLDASLLSKITPGQQSAVQLQISGTRSQLAKLAKEGNLPLPVAGLFGLGAGAGTSGAQASGGAVAPANAAKRLGTLVRGVSGEAGAALAEPVPTHAEARTARATPSATRIHAGAGNETATIEAKATAPIGSVFFAKKSLVRVGPGHPSLVLPPTELGGPTGYVQLLLSDGEVIHTPSKGNALPITAATRAVAAGRKGTFFSDAKIKGTPYRVLTAARWRRAERGRWPCR